MPRFDTMMIRRRTSNESRIAVISDIHSNADALNIALKELKKKNVDITVVLVDILTYGCQPIQVLEMLIEYKRKNPLIFIKGNHNQFYFDLQSAHKKTSYKLPRFIDESVNWILKKISPLLLKDIFTWYDSYIIGDDNKNENAFTRFDLDSKLVKESFGFKAKISLKEGMTLMKNKMVAPC